MATLTPPTIDARDEDQLVADTVDSLPASQSDRTASNPAVKLIEACGAIYAALMFALNSWPERVMVKLLQLLDIQIEVATYAEVDVTFARSSNATDLTIPAGTVVKVGLSASDVRFLTTTSTVMASGGSLTADIPCRALKAGASGNVAASTLVHLDTPISTVASVTNSAGATGGQDAETQEAAIARAPLTLRANNRAVTAEDFETLSVDSDNGIARAVAYSLANGGVTVDVLAADDLNETPSPAVQTAVTEYLQERTLPGIVIEVNQRTTRLLAITNIVVTLEDGYTASGVKPDVKQALADFLTAVDVYDSSQVLTASGWTYGEGVVENDFVSIIAAVDGIKRVVSMDYQYSDDYGDTAWPAVAAMDATGVDAPDAVWGLLHWGYDDTTFPSMGNDPDAFLVNGV